MTTFTRTANDRRSHSASELFRRIVATAGAIALGAILAIAPGLSNDSVGAATPFGQCNGVYNTPGLGITCTVTITNTFNAATGHGKSVTVLKSCHGAANTAPSSCISSTRSSNSVITSVSQCNSAINGGGGTVICSVRVINNITGVSKVSPASVNECIGSAGGGGTQPTLSCHPGGNTSNAVVTQCNGSANGGGGTMRVRCTVLGSTSASALRVTINQCNGSANGGGSKVTCTAQVTNHVRTASSSGGSSSSGGQGSATSGKPPAVSKPTAAELLAAANDQASAEAAMAGVLGSDSSSTSARETSLAEASQALRDANAAAALAERLAYTGIEASVYVTIALITLLVGGVLFVVGRRRNRTSDTVA
jgi:LPXTG-motif cell wall-anchored protein